MTDAERFFAAQLFGWHRRSTSGRNYSACSFRAGMRVFETAGLLSDTLTAEEGERAP
jgi:hypothetical protein